MERKTTNTPLSKWSLTYGESGFFTYPNTDLEFERHRCVKERHIDVVSGFGVLQISQCDLGRAEIVREDWPYKHMLESIAVTHDLPVRVIVGKLTRCRDIQWPLSGAGKDIGLPSARLST